MGSRTNLVSSSPLSSKLVVSISPPLVSPLVTEIAELDLRV